MTVSFFNDNGFIREQTYTTLAEQVIGFIDMIDTVKAGGWCLVCNGRSAQMITNLSQLLR